MKTAFAILAGLILAFFAFSAVKPAKKEKQQAVYYYPKANVYHDLNENEYYFYHSEQKEWIATKNISDQQKGSLGESVAVATTSPVWKNNPQDRMVYSVNLFAKPALIKKHLLEDSMKMVPRKKPVAVSRPVKDSISLQEEKPKKGLKKFFDKLFGKKKDAGS